VREQQVAGPHDHEEGQGHHADQRAERHVTADQDGEHAEGDRHGGDERVDDEEDADAGGDPLAALHAQEHVEVVARHGREPTERDHPGPEAEQRGQQGGERSLDRVQDYDYHRGEHADRSQDVGGPDVAGADLLDVHTVELGHQEAGRDGAQEVADHGGDCGQHYVEQEAPPGATVTRRSPSIVTGAVKAV